MKKIDTIIIHCSATRAGQDIKAKTLIACTGLAGSIR